MKLGPKLILLFLVFGAVPLLISSIAGQAAMGKMATAAQGSLESQAGTLVQRVERNLFERYGDVQAFGYNEVIFDRGTWYQKGDGNKVVGAMKKYMAAYTPIYEMMMLVDTQGKPIAVSNVGYDGKPVDTNAFYSQNYAHETWFKNSVAGKFLSGDGITGTWVDDAHTDKDIAKAFGNAGTVITYSAPVTDSSGKVIAVWHNYARMALVESIVQEGYNELKKSGFPSAAIRVLNDKGLILSEFDPTKTKGEYVNDASRILAYDYGKQSKVGQAIMSKGTGNLVADSEGRNTAAGYKESEGALGYPGLGWHIAVEVPSSEFFSSINASKRSQFILMFLTLAVVGVCAWFISKTISRPLSQMAVALTQAAEGRVDITMEYQSKDEAGIAADALRAMIRKVQQQANVMNKLAAGDLTVKPTEPVREYDVMNVAIFKTVDSYRQTVQQLQEMSAQARGLASDLTSAFDTLTQSSLEVVSAAEEIRASSEEVAKASHDVADSSELQAESLSRISERIVEMTTALHSVKEAVAGVSQSAKDAASTAKMSGTQVGETLEGMGVIRETTSVVSKRLGDLQERSQRIGDIASTIEDIAEQTNLLALNAAIEAARAGEHGRGFAVVAEEVRKLAEHASSATGEITSLISEIGSLVDASNRAMNDANKAVKDGMELSASARESLDEIVTQVAALERPVREVAAHTDEVASMASQASLAVDEAAGATQSNSAAAEEMAASSTGVSEQVGSIANMSQVQNDLNQQLADRVESLRALAERLDETVQMFKLESETGDSFAKAA